MGFGNGSAMSTTGVVPNMVGVCTPIPPVQFVAVGTPGCSVGCEFIRTYPSNPQPLLGGMHISPSNLYAACGHLSRCPDMILVEGTEINGQAEGKVFSCSKIVHPYHFHLFRSDELTKDEHV